MIDHTFSAALTLGLLLAGSLAIGSALFGLDQPAAAAPARAVRVVELPPVVVVAKRLAPGATLASSAQAIVSAQPL